MTCVRPYVRPSVNFHIFQFTAYSFYPIELKLGRMIADVSSHNRSGPDFSISCQRGFWRRALQCSNRFTAYSSYPIELKFRIIPDISPHNRYEQDFLRAGGVRVTEFFADVICACSLISLSREISISSVWEMTGAIFTIIIMIAKILTFVNSHFSEWNVVQGTR